MKYVTAFGRFWWDFIVGDSAILAVGGVAVLLVGAVLVNVGRDSAAGYVLPALVIATLGLSLRGSE